MEVLQLFSTQQGSNLSEPISNKVTGFKSFEVTECVIKCLNNIIRLCTIYRTTSVTSKSKYNETKIDVFLNEFDHYLDDLANKSGYPIICGDFNFHVQDSNDCMRIKVTHNMCLVLHIFLVVHYT